MVRMIAILAVFGLVAGLYLRSASGSVVQVTFLGGGVPTYDASNFEDCGPDFSSGAAANDDCYAYLRRDSDETTACDYIIGFRAGDAKVSRLRVKIALMRDGKVVDRDSVQINSLDRPDGDPYVSKTIRGECNVKQLRITEAHAFVAGEETDLIARGVISSKGIMPLIAGSFIGIGAAES